MRKIEMVDLKNQYQPIKDQVNSGIQQVIDTASFINGPQVNQFQEDLENYLGVKHVIPCANGTDALQIAMMGLGLEPGDEVITVDFTFAATAEVIALLGLSPVLVDAEKDSFNIDPKAVENAITEKTKAIVPVHLFGQTADMDALTALAKEHDLFIIEDTAQAIGAEYQFKDGTTQKAGTIGDIGTTSFFPSKNLGCYGDGGALFTNDDKHAEYLRGIVNHGMMARYQHDIVGVNSRLDSIQAAVLRVKLPKLDAYNKARRDAAKQYTAKLENHDNIACPQILKDDESHVFHQYTLRILNGKRNELIEFLQANDVPCGVYYPIPLHHQKAYQDERYSESDFEVTNALVKEVISLPMHTELDREQIEYITDMILSFMDA